MLATPLGKAAICLHLPSLTVQSRLLRLSHCVVAGSVAAGVQARMNRAPAGGREGERGRGRGGRGSRGRGYDRPYGREGVENAAGESAAEHGGDARSGGGRGRGRGGEGRRGRRDYDRQDGTGRG